MSITFNSAIEVFLFIICCSGYVCSTLWIYGDAATRDMGMKGTILPLAFITAAALALTMGWLYALVVWPVGYAAWFVMRPKVSHVIKE